MQRLALQAPQIVISVGSKRDLCSSQRMLNLGKSVRMVVTVSVHFRTCGLSACRMGMRHRSRVVRKSIDRGGYIIATQQVALYLLCLTAFYVIVVGYVNLITTAQYRYRTTRQRTPAVAGSVLCKLAGREASTAYKAVIIVVVLHM